MEPMTLGSPVGSPTNPSLPTSPYLPGFLMGDPAPQPTSPSKTPKQVHFTPNISLVHTPNTPGPASFNENLSRFHKNQREKSGGPPTVGLFDTLEVSSADVTPSGFTSQTFHHTNKLTQPSTPSQLTTASPHYNSQNIEESEKWVIVFGFPPSAAASILGQFSQVGHIVEHRFPGQGNWVNICFASKLDARRALSYNGKILGGHTMIGVFPCRDHNGSALKDMTNMLTSTATPSTPQASRIPHRHIMTSPTSPPYLPSPRGGRALGIANPTENEVMVAQNTPTKNTSFVTKAVDFVFGW